MLIIWNEVFIRPIFNVLIFLHNIIPGHDLGIAIILLTLIIRFILAPSSAKALKSQKEMQKVQPELTKLREKYKNDKQKQTQAMLELYKKHNIHPFSACLPTLLQLPFLIALFVVLRSSLVAQNYNLLYPFIHRPEILNTTFLGLIDLSIIPKVTSLASLLTYKGNVILGLLTGGLQFYQSKMLMPKTASPGDTASSINRQMTYFFPIMIIFFSLSLPGGLPLSWAVTTGFSIIQQTLVFKKEPKND